MRALIGLLAIALAAPALATPGAPPTESCSVIAGTPPVSVAAPELSVIVLSAANSFSLPAGLPSEVQAVHCERASIVPAEFDYKVVQAGYPFAISVPGGGTLWLELQNGQLGVSFGEGDLSEGEAAQTQEWLNRVQPNFHKQELPGDGDGV